MTKILLLSLCLALASCATYYPTDDEDAWMGKGMRDHAAARNR